MMNKNNRLANKLGGPLMATTLAPSKAMDLPVVQSPVNFCQINASGEMDIAEILRSDAWSNSPFLSFVL
jgi:hypothetical protein